jgi:sugar phosphate isomerase/epimerase
MGNRSFEEVIGFASGNKFRCVEIMCWPVGKAERKYAGVSHINVDELTDTRIISLQEFLKEKKVFISGLGYYPNPLDPDEKSSGEYVEHIKKVIKAASRLGVPVMNTFIGRDPRKPLEENFEKFREVWPPIIRFAEDSGVKIGIENCPMIFTKDEWPGGKNLATHPAIWKKMFEHIPSPNFGLNYDPSHMIWQFMDEIKPLYDFRDRIFHVHLKDARIMKDQLDLHGIMAYPLYYHVAKIPGLGQVRWRDFFAALTQINYRGPVCIEVEDKSFEGSDERIEESLLIARNYLSQFLALQDG